MIRKPITCENHFSCLPEIIAQLSKLSVIDLRNCTRLSSLPQLPSTTEFFEADGCTSLETFPNGLKPKDTYTTNLFLVNCFKLAGRSDMFFNVLRMLLTFHQVSLSLSLPLSLYKYIYVCV